MIVTTVTVYVKPENIDDFIEATIENHEASIEEPGNMRFDVLQSMTDPTRFLLYEAYQSEEEAAAHKKTEHYLKWRKTVASWMAKPREGIPHRVIYPKDRSKW
ncbi:MAG TPA: antibiotic biosynthesis monooxygenase [Thermoplasmata archaeon]|nr:antibiotic biosynthesis monooxygenase [Thermoplasmata archaeon]